MILSLVYYGNQVLRMRSKEIPQITDEIKQLIFDMIETMDANNGVGLAAIQVGKPLRVFVIRGVLEDDDGKSFLGEPEVYINPKITKPSSVSEVSEEGCLSVPGVHSDVDRPIMINIEALDLEGNKISKEIKGYKAREIMHENDHLNGVLFLDRLTAKKRKEIEPSLREIKEKYN